MLTLLLVADGLALGYLVGRNRPRARAAKTSPARPDPARGIPPELADLPVEVRTLVHAVDRMRDEWAESGVDRCAELWTRLHESCDAVWDRQSEDPR